MQLRRDQNEPDFLLPADAPWLLDASPPSPRPQHRHRRRALRAALIVAGTLALIAAAGGGYLYWQAHSLLAELHAGGKGAVVAQARQALGSRPSAPLASRITAEKPTKVGQPAPAVEQKLLNGAQTILLIGSDQRWGEHGGRSDTMLLVRIVPAEKTVSVLSIPRDLRVPIPGHGLDKVNAAFAYGGEKLLIETLRDYLGVTIDHFVEVNFGGFDKVVNALGGVYIPVDQRYYNHNIHTAATDYADIDLQPGYQKLNATNALSYVRFRHLDSDFTRAARQQLFIRETERQVLASKFDFTRMNALIHAFAAATASDINSLGELWQLVNTLRSTPAERATRLTIPAQGQMISGIDYEIADPTSKDATVARWYHPEWTVRQQASITQTVVQAQQQLVPQARTQDLSSDDGRALALVAPLQPQMERCAPSLLPHGYAYPSSDAARAYTLAGQPALAFYATQSSGRSLLWMETTWQTPPILSSPTRTATVAGRPVEIWEESGTIRQVAFHLGKTRVWLTNTLQNALAPRDMLALAASCKSVG